MVPRMAAEAFLVAQVWRRVARAGRRKMEPDPSSCVAVVITILLLGAGSIGPAHAQTNASTPDARLTLEAIPEGSVVYVDGVPTSDTLAERGLEMNAGSHRVEVAYEDGRVETFAVRLQPGKARSLKVDRIAEEDEKQPADVEAFSIWPAVAASGAAGGFALVSVVYSVVFLRSLADYNAAVREAAISDIEGASAPFAIVPLDLQRKRRALRADGIATAIFVPAAAVAALVAGGLWGAYAVTSGAIATE